MLFPISIIDQIGNHLKIAKPVKKIVSVVPSQTELLFHLGLENEIVGLTKFCVLPTEKVKLKPKIGGTKKLKLDKISALNPDLIIANKEENSISDIEYLQGKFNVYTSNIYNLSDALKMISDIGLITNKNAESETLISEIKLAISGIKKPKTSLKVIYLIWKNPFMAAGADTFISNMMQLAGFKNLINTNRYPEIKLEEIIRLNPNYIFLSSEPFPFKKKHGEELKKNTKINNIKIVDGQMFSWYGSSLLHFGNYINQNF